MNFEYDDIKKVKKENHTGIPDNMKNQFERYSSMFFDDVRVHYNSALPSQLNAIAYTQGKQVYIAPGQDKHLPHELGHVVQQKRGMVKPTAIVNGVPINENAELEAEADNFFTVGHKYSNMAVTAMSDEKAPIQMKKRKPDTQTKAGTSNYNPKGEAASVFDFYKLKRFLRKLITVNIQRKNRQWLGKSLSKKEMEIYTKKVQTLLEDIRQVDLQFLAVSAISFEEEGLLEDMSSYENVLITKEKTNFEKDINMQNMYKNIIMLKLSYMYQIKQELQKNPKRYSQKYLEDVKKQVAILQTLLKNGPDRGYVYNLNSLLVETDDKIKMYMAIVSPSRVETYKDISVDGRDKLKAYSNQLQFGIGTPVRSFSWYLKYLMDISANANNTPIIRSVDMPKELWERWQQTAVSEAYKNGNDNMPMNEDQKIFNQFGVPVSSDIFKELININPKLTTIGEQNSIPERLKAGAGEFKELKNFKDEIGFRRVKEGKQTMTDVHFFDFEHTAFHEISDSGSPSLYSPKKAEEMYTKYSNLISSLILVTGKNEYIDKIGKENIVTGKPLKNSILIDRITMLLEANHWLPENRKYDLHGNSKRSLETENEFALNYIANSTFERDGKPLLDLTKTRYIIWYNIYEKKFDEIKEKSKKSKEGILITKKLSDAEKKKRINLLIKSENNNIMKNIYAEISPIINNSGILFELQELGRISGEDNNELYSRLPTGLNIDDLFDNLKKIYESSKAGKLHVIAFCFKLLRLIKDDNPQQTERKTDTDNLNKVERELFAERESGDYFDVVNRHEGRNISIAGENVFIPFDKMTSTGRFKPKGNKPKYEAIPFIGGASGTTRDITRDLLNKDEISKGLLKNEDEYWKFQMLNASFMITYSYHSFVEVIYRAAVTRLEYYDKEEVSKNIINYFSELSSMNYMPESDWIISDIKYIIENKKQVNISKYFKNRESVNKNNRNTRKTRKTNGNRKQSRQNRRNRLLRDNMPFDETDLSSDEEYM